MVVVGKVDVTCDVIVVGEVDVTCDLVVVGEVDVTCDVFVVGEVDVTCDVVVVVGEVDVTCDAVVVVGEVDVTCDVTGSEGGVVMSVKGGVADRAEEDWRDDVVDDGGDDAEAWRGAYCEAVVPVVEVVAAGWSKGGASAGGLRGGEPRVGSLSPSAHTHIQIDRHTQTYT